MKNLTNQQQKIVDFIEDFDGEILVTNDGKTIGVIGGVGMMDGIFVTNNGHEVGESPQITFTPFQAKTFEFTNPRGLLFPNDVKMALHKSPADYGRIIKGGKERAVGTKKTAFKNRLKKRRNKRR